MEHKWSLNDIRHFWLAACRGQPLTHPNGDFAQKESLLINNGNLGYMPRLFAIQSTIGATRYGMLSAAASAIGQPKLVSNANKIFSPGTKNSPGAIERLFYEILRQVNDWRVRHGKGQFPSVKSLFEVRFEGEDALDAFLSYLSQPRITDQPLVSKVDFLYKGDSQREALLIELEEALKIDTADVAVDSVSFKARPMLINLHGENLWSGLTAVSCHLPHLLQDDDPRQVLVLPLRRLPDNTTEGKPGQILSLAQILGYLRAFVDFGLVGVENAEPVSDSDGMFDVVQHVRCKLAQNPAIIVFDGYGDLNETSSIERHIADDYVESLITRLLDPPFPNLPASEGSSVLTNISNFRKNRIVVTSGIALDDWADNVPEIPGVSPILSRTLTAPTKTEYGQIFEILGLRRREATAKLRQHTALQFPLDDSVYLIDALLVLAEKVGLSDDDVSALLQERCRLGRKRVGLTELVETILDVLEQRAPRWFEIAEIVTFSPDGVRGASVHRIAVGAISMDENPFPHLSEAFQMKELVRELADFQNLIPIFIGAVREDKFEGLDGVSNRESAEFHTHEFGLNAGVSDHAWVSSSRAIDYLFAECKSAARIHLCRKIGTEHLDRMHRMHRLFAEDTLSQQTIALRHIDHTVSQSIRPWRRMLSVLYHGLVSLPIALHQGKAKIKNSISFGARTLPECETAVDFWQFLYAFCYRRMIERPPAWNLSRYYGLDDLKCDLLEAFDRPWRLWPGSLAPSTNYWGLVSGGKPNTLQSDHMAALVQGRLSAAQLSLARTALNTASRERGGSVAAEHRRFKRLCDMNLLECKPIDRGEFTEHVRRHMSGANWDYLNNTLDMAVKQLEQGKMGDVSYSCFDRTLDFATPIAGIIASSRDDEAAIKLSALYDLFARWGEHLATRADLASIARHGDSDLAYVRQQRILSESKINFEDQQELAVNISKDFLESFCYFSLSEQIRLRIFKIDPLGAKFFASGNSARQSIRVALKLASPLDRENSLRMFFQSYARRASDKLTQNLFRYPRERASQIVLEATMLRLLSGPHDRIEKLRVASAFLTKVDAMVVGLGRKTRVRMRLALERAKVSRGLAESLWELDDPEWKIRLEHCECDLSLLAQMARRSEMPLWRILAHVQTKRTERFKNKAIYSDKFC